MQKIPISGGPHTGKTTLLEALKIEFPDAYFVPEPATEVIERELALQQAKEAYEPRVPWIDYSKFAPLVLAKSVELEACIPSDADLVFQDRSLIDTIAYARLNNVMDIIPYTEDLVAEADYTAALFCEPVGVYAGSDIRRESSDEAARTHVFLQEAYRESELRFIDLPAIPTAGRIALVREMVIDPKR